MLFSVVFILVAVASAQDESLNEKEPEYVPTIVGGVNAYLGDYPHMASLGFEGDDYVVWLCGGSLISNRYVLTAAHCLSSQQFGKVKYVRLGTVLLNGGQPQNYLVSKTIPHPKYKPPSVYHDIALLRLNREVQTNKYIKPAQLFSEKTVPQYLSTRAIGWGLTEHGGRSSNILQHVTLDLFSYEECQTSYATVSTRRLPNGLDDETQICAGGRNSERDTCQGDSGGPLEFFTYYNRVHFLIGITSIGKACGSVNTPSIYTRVSYYKDWIEENMKS